MQQTNYTAWTDTEETYDDQTGTFDISDALAASLLNAQPGDVIVLNFGLRGNRTYGGGASGLTVQVSDGSNAITVLNNYSQAAGTYTSMNVQLVFPITVAGKWGNCYQTMALNANGSTAIYIDEHSDLDGEDIGSLTLQAAWDQTTNQLVRWWIQATRIRGAL